MPNSINSFGKQYIVFACVYDAIYWSALLLRKDQCMLNAWGKTMLLKLTRIFTAVFHHYAPLYNHFRHQTGQING